MSESQQPDFIITVGGKDLTKHCLGWELTDDEEGMSRLSVELANHEMKLSGVANEWDTVAIRFGYQNNLSGQAQFSIMEIRENYPSDNNLSITVSGYDESQKLAGEKKKGNYDEKSVVEVIKELGKRNGIDVHVDGNGVKFNEQKISQMNENDHQMLRKLMQLLEKKKSKNPKAPKSPMSGQTGQPSTQSSGGVKSVGRGTTGTGKIPLTSSDDDEIDQNRLDNSVNNAKNDPITARLDLIGYPSLKAKKCVDVLNVGPKASGKYYVKSVRHSWRAGSGFRTSADLIRSGSGKGDAQSDPPNVVYAEIYDKKKMRVGARQTEGESQGQFTYGTGENVISFEFNSKVQLNRGGGEGTAESSAHDIRKKLEEAKAEVKGSGSDSGK